VWRHSAAGILQSGFAAVERARAARGEPSVRALRLQSTNGTKKHRRKMAGRGGPPRTEALVPTHHEHKPRTRQETGGPAPRYVSWDAVVAAADDVDESSGRGRPSGAAEAHL